MLHGEGSFFSPILWHRCGHQLLKVLAVVDGIENATPVANIVEIEPDVEDDAADRKHAEVHHEPEVALLLLRVQADRGDKRRDSQSNILDRRAQSVSRSDKPGRYRVRDATPEGGGVDGVADTEKDERNEADIVRVTLG